jgi:hypothetical protein
LVVALVFLDVVLCRIREEVGNDENSDIASFGFGPRKKILEVFGWDALLVVFAVEEPLLLSSRAVYIDPLKEAFDVSSTIRRASLLAVPLRQFRLTNPTSSSKSKQKSSKSVSDKRLNEILCLGFIVVVA